MTAMNYVEANEADLGFVDRDDTVRAVVTVDPPITCLRATRGGRRLKSYIVAWAFMDLGAVWPYVVTDATPQPRLRHWYVEAGGCSDL